MLLHDTLRLSKSDEFSIIGPLFAGIPVVFEASKGTLPLASYIAKCLTDNPKSVWDRYSMNSSFVVMQMYPIVVDNNIKIFTIELDRSDDFLDNVLVGASSSSTHLTVHRHHTLVSFAGRSLPVSLTSFGLACLLNSISAVSSDESKFKSVAEDCNRFITTKYGHQMILELAQILDEHPGLSELRSARIGVAAPIQAYYQALFVMVVYKLLNDKYEAGYTTADLSKALQALMCFTKVNGAYNFKSFIEGVPVRTKTAKDTMAFADIVNQLEGGDATS